MDFPVSHAMPWHHVLGGIFLVCLAALWCAGVVFSVLFPTPADHVEDGSDA